jgi:sirohydrochlorin cobaltochelatase
VAKAVKNKSALVYMGHGNEVLSTGAYVELQDALRDANPNMNIFIGNVEGYPQPEDEKDSWKNLFESHGIKVVPVLRGLGEVDEWVQIYVKHLQEAMTAYHF